MSGLERQQWLETATEYLAAHIAECGGDVPENVRVSVGFPRGGRKTIGQCWYVEASSDGHHEIFVSPVLTADRILDVLCHELIHAACGKDAGHKAPFKKLATACGLTGKMTATVAGPEFERWAEHFIENHGPYPAGHINEKGRGKKQSTRLLKAECQECGHTVRTTRKWVETIGTPICPCNMEPMEIQ